MHGCGNPQPGEMVWSDVLYIGKGASEDVPLTGQVFAGTRPPPEDLTLPIPANVSKTRMTMAELTLWPDPV